MTPAGRPPLPPEQRRTERLQLFLSPVEKAAYESEAEARGVTVAELVRDTMDKMIKRGRRTR